MSKPNKNDFLNLCQAYLRAKRRDLNLSKYLSKHGTQFYNDREVLEVAIEDWLLQYDLGDSLLNCIKELAEEPSIKFKINKKEIYINSLDNLYDIYYGSL